MKCIPNILSLARAPLAFLLIYIATLHKPFLFVCIYAITALTDALDGFLARKFHWESDFGAKIDGFADILFTLSMIFTVLFVLKIQFDFYIILGVCAIVLLRIANILFTKIKFKQWGTIHSFLLRYGSIPLFLLPPVLVWTEKAQNALVLLALIISFISVLDETLILVLLEEYDMNTKSAWHAKKQREQ